ncbi:MAG: hypothetical protein ACYDCH_08245 [Gaiellaceae bacterium]
MTRERRRLTSAFAVVTIGLAIALGLGPASTQSILSAYVLALAAIALASLTRIAAEPALRLQPSPFADALRPRRHDRMRPPELVRVEREIALGTSTAAHLHLRLLPLLREAAAARLAAHHNVDLERRPEAARRLLGDEVWEQLRPDRPVPVDRNAPGMPLRTLRTLVDTLERL